jgi:GNAT superfamily N-acetyltransferase
LKIIELNENNYKTYNRNLSEMADAMLLKDIGSVDRTFALLDRGDLVGFCIVDCSTQEWDRSEGNAHIPYVYINQNYRGRRLSKKLQKPVIEYVTQWCAQKHIKQLNMAVSINSIEGAIFLDVLEKAFEQNLPNTLIRSMISEPLRLRINKKLGCPASSL